MNINHVPNGNINIMEMLKSQMMSMMMIKNMGNPSSSSGFEMIYLLVATQFVEIVMKYLPFVINIIYQKYMQRIQTTFQTKMVEGIAKTVKSSIMVTVKMNDNDNTLALALMDFITNNKNTSYVSYKNKGFILNQTTDIQITNDIFAVMRNSTDNPLQTVGEQNAVPISQVVEIYSYLLTVDELRAFMDDIKNRYLMMQKNKLGTYKYFFNMVNKPAQKNMDGNKDFSRLPMHMSFTMKRFQTNRKFSNLFGENIDTIKERVNFFVNNKNWYDEKGIPYTLGLLLSGNPGTGKTSTIKCLANETNRHIFNINFNNDITKTQLENLFFNEQIVIEGGMEAVCIPLDQRIYVFEDIDCQNSAECISRNGGNNSQHQLDLSFLLNLLDGVLEMPGRIIIMTSNNPERLDHALVRPGRIDIVAKYSNCTNETIQKMIEFFYNCQLDEAEIAKLNTLQPLLYTPAEIGKILFENFGNKYGIFNALKIDINPVNAPTQTIVDINNNKLDAQNKLLPINTRLMGNNYDFNKIIKQYETDFSHDISDKDFIYLFNKQTALIKLTDLLSCDKNHNSEYLKYIEILNETKKLIEKKHRELMYSLKNEKIFNKHDYGTINDNALSNFNYTLPSVPNYADDDFTHYNENINKQMQIFKNTYFGKNQCDKNINFALEKRNFLTELNKTICCNYTDNLKKYENDPQKMDEYTQTQTKNKVFEFMIQNELLDLDKYICEAHHTSGGGKCEVETPKVFVALNNNDTALINNDSYKTDSVIVYSKITTENNNHNIKNILNYRDVREDIKPINNNEINTYNDILDSQLKTVNYNIKCFDDESSIKWFNNESSIKNASLFEY